MKLRTLLGSGLAIACSASAITYTPINAASLKPWTTLNAATGATAAADMEFTLKYSIDSYKASFTPAQVAEIQEAFREYSAIFSANPYPWGRILFQNSMPSDQVHFEVTTSSNSNNAAGAGCATVAGHNYCTIYLQNSHQIRYWIARALGVPASGTASDVLGAPAGSTIPFTVNDLNLISNTYSALKLDPNGNPHSKPLFLADYYNTADGNEIIIGWDALRNRLNGRGPYTQTSGTFRTIAAVPLRDGLGYAITFPLQQYQVQTANSGLANTVWPYLNTDWSTMAPYGIKGTETTPVLGQGTCLWTGSYTNTTSSPAYGLFASDPSKGYLHGGQFGASISPYTTFPSQYTTPVYFYQNGVTYSATTRQPNSSCFRLGGYALAVE